jgi:hypothetical protein
MRLQAPRFECVVYIKQICRSTVDEYKESATPRTKENRSNEFDKKVTSMCKARKSAKTKHRK